MKTKFTMMLTLFMALIVQISFAQQKTVSGTVSDENGLPLIGTTVLVVGTSSGTTTDFDGNYSIRAKTGDVLSYSYVGYATQNITVGAASTINLALQPDNTLDEVVVTALGIKRDEKSIGYSTQKISNEDITTVRGSNVVNSLSGKIAGVHVTSASSAPGASSRIILRGLSTIYGNTQPLIIVDGIPIDNNSYASRAFDGASDDASASGGQDVPNGLADINQDDIESLNVLKGGPATALYGMRGSNGVIVVTTKSGKGLTNKRLGISINSSVQIDDVALLPSYQNSYGQGNNQEYFEYKNGYGTTNAYSTGVGGVDESWGPPLDVGLSFIQWNSFDGKPKPWVSAPNGVRNFYNRGVTVNHNISLNGNSENSNYRVSIGNSDQTGILHNTNYTKTNIAGNVRFNLSEKWKTGISVNYIKTGSDNLPNLGYDTSTNNTQTAQLVWAARQVDFKDLVNWKELPLNTTGTNAGTPVNWNQAYNNNPFWALETNTNTLEKDRVIGNIEIGYDFSEHLNLTLKSGIDIFTSLNTSRAAFGTASNEFGYYKETGRTRESINSEFLLSYNRSITDDFKFNISFGGNTYQNNYRRNYIEAPQLQLPNVYNISNTRDGSNPVSTHRKEELKINSLYGFAQISFKDYLYLDITARNDWASVLPINNNSFFYPSVSMSTILSDILNLNKSYVSFLKLRGGWSNVGSAGPLDPYKIESSYQFSNDPWGTTPIAFLPGTLWNPTIKNENSNEYEIGIDGRFFKNRLTIDLTYYDKKTEDVILPVPKTAASGFTSAWDNAASITNTGIELSLGTKIIQSENGLNLGLSINFGKNKNLVDDIDSDQTTNEGAINLGGLWEVDIQAREGQPMGVIWGPAFARDDNSNIIYKDGLATYDEDYKILGNTTPDWTGGVGIDMSWRGIRLYSLFDIKKGGDLYSQTNSWGKYAGILEETLQGREEGVVGLGVDVNGGPNTTVVNAQDFYKAFYTPDVGESSVYDASYVKWRELSLSYKIPKTLLKKIKIEDVTFGFNVRNLLILYKKAPHIDPETSFGNTTGQQGLEYAQLPPTRSYGFNLNLKF